MKRPKAFWYSAAQNEGQRALQTEERVSQRRGRLVCILEDEDECAAQRTAGCREIPPDRTKSRRGGRGGPTQFFNSFLATLLFPRYPASSSAPRDRPVSSCPLLCLLPSQQRVIVGTPAWCLTSWGTPLTFHHQAFSHFGL